MRLWGKPLKEFECLGYPMNIVERRLDTFKAQKLTGIDNTVTDKGRAAQKHLRMMRQLVCFKGTL